MKRGEATFQVIHFDYIYMPRSFNGMQYLLHLYDTYSSAHQVFAMSTKDAKAITQLIVGFVRWTALNGFKCVKIHTDQDPNVTGLNTSLKGELQSMGAQLTTSTPHNHEQNGLAERAGRMLVIVMRSIRVHAGLPVELWPWLAEAAAYLLNRTPIKRASWRVPFELMTGRVPSLANLRVIGCKAYVVRKMIPKRDKLDERTWIGYLVGFHSGNIWSIWNPGSNRVFRCRDVVFDESMLYKDTKQEDGQLQGQAEAIAQAIKENETQPRQILEPHAMSTATPSRIVFPGCTSSSSAPANHKENSDHKEKFGHPQELTKPGNRPSTQLITPEHTPEPIDVVTGCTIRQFFAHDHVQSQIDDTLSGIITSFLVCDGRDSVERLTFDQAVMVNTSILGGSYSRPHISTVQPPPRSWKAMQNHVAREHWIAAAQREINEIETRKTWTKATRDDSQGHDVLPTKWVFTYKPDADGYIQGYKARLVVRGDLQTTHISKAELYAHTAAMNHFRVLIAIAAHHGWRVHQLDAINAFLQSYLAEDEIFYVTPPPGAPALGVPASGVVYRLRRALYGLRISPRLWHKTCTDRLRSLGFEQVKEEPCLWRYKSSYVFFYVDDFCVTGPSPEIDTVVGLLKTRIDMRDIGEASMFLGIEIQRRQSDGVITLNQALYVERMAAKYGVKFDQQRRPDTPIRLPRILLAKNEDLTTSSPALRLQMQQLTGALLYLSVQTRPDIAKAVNICSENAVNPTKAHVQAALQIIEYALATKHYGLHYGRPGPLLVAAGDAAFADDVPTRRSSHGYVVFLYGAPVFWTSKRQDTVAHSTTEAELTALSTTVREVIALTRLLGQLGIKIDEDVVVLCDNQTTVDVVNGKTNVVSTKLRHMDIRQHWLRELILSSPPSPLLGGVKMDIRWIPTAEMPADGLTKLLERQKHHQFVQHMRLILNNAEERSAGKAAQGGGDDGKDEMIAGPTPPAGGGTRPE
jgi:Reverse transcriptase (RNA-dependent DNA polymerase)